MPSSSRCSGSIAVRTVWPFMACLPDRRERRRRAAGSDFAASSVLRIGSSGNRPSANTAATISAEDRLLAPVEVGERLVRRLRRAEQEALARSAACRARPARRRRRRRRPAISGRSLPALVQRPRRPEGAEQDQELAGEAARRRQADRGERQDHEEHRVDRQQLGEPAVGARARACGSARRSCRP